MYPYMSFSVWCDDVSLLFICFGRCKKSSTHHQRIDPLRVALVFVVTLRALIPLLATRGLNADLRAGGGPRFKVYTDDEPLRKVKLRHTTEVVLS